MIVNRTDIGEYEVQAQDGTNRRLAGPFPTHAAAWRWIDRQSGEPISPAEKKSQWLTYQGHGTGGGAV